jgi:hypothetical protein
MPSKKNKSKGTTPSGTGTEQKTDEKVLTVNAAVEAEANNVPVAEPPVVITSPSPPTVIIEDSPWRDIPDTAITASRMDSIPPMTPPRQSTGSSLAEDSVTMNPLASAVISANNSKDDSKKIENSMVHPEIEASTSSSSSSASVKEPPG